MRPAGKAIVIAAAVVASGIALIVGEVLVARTGEAPYPNPPTPYQAAAGPAGTPVASVVWLGDSTAAGVGVTTLAQTLPEQSASLLGQPVSLTVLAHSGDRIADVLKNQVPRVAALQPSVVFLSIGANDATHLTPRGDFRRDYQAVLAALPPSVHRVVMLGVPDMGASPRLAQPLRALAGWRGEELNADVRHLAARTPDALYVDIAALTGPPFRRDPTRYFARDHYHPNAAGYALWAQAIAGAAAKTRAGAYG